MWYVRDVLYAVLYVRVSCFVVRGCGVSMRYIDVCYCDMFSVVNVYLDHLSLGTTCRLSGSQLEDDGSSACVLHLALYRPVSILEVDEGYVPGGR